MAMMNTLVHRHKCTIFNMTKKYQTIVASLSVLNDGCSLKVGSVVQPLLFEVTHSFKFLDLKL